MKYDIEVDQDLKEFIPIFKENRQKDIEALKLALAEKDQEKIQFIGHSLKGVGSGYGFVEVTNIGQVIEAKAKENAMGDIKLLITQLEDYMTHVKITYVEED